MKIVEDDCLFNFLQGYTPNLDSRRYYDFLMMTDEEVERCHNIIQWVFPTDEISQYNPAAPVLTAEVIEKIRNDDRCQRNLKYGFDRMIEFFYSSYDPDSRNIFGWVTVKNHNYLRISRMLRSLDLIDSCSNLKLRLWTFCEFLFADESVTKTIGPETFDFWKKNVGKI